MLAWRVVVGILMGLIAAWVVAFFAQGVLGAYLSGWRDFRVSEQGNELFYAVWAVGSLLSSFNLVRNSPSAREAFRRSLPIIGLGSLCVDLLVLAVVIVDISTGVQYDPTASGGGPLVQAIGILILLAPVICWVLYYWIVPSEFQPTREWQNARSGDSGTRKWTLTGLVVAGAITVFGLAIGVPCVTVMGIVVVVVSAIMLIWMK